MLLIQQQDYFEPELLVWTLPAGGIEGDETPAEGAAREVLEETGCRLDPAELMLVSTVSSTHRGRVLSTSWNFTATTDLPDLQPDNGPDGEVVTAAWTDVDEAIRLLGHHSDDPIREPALHFLRTGERGRHWSFEVSDLTQRPPEFTWGPPESSGGI